MTRFAMIGLLALGCHGKTSNPGDHGTTDPGNTDTGADDTGAESCQVSVIEIQPRDGATDVYYRDHFSVLFSDPADQLATFSLQDGAGVDYSLELRWDDTGLNASLASTSPLEPDTGYTLTVDVCDQVSSAQFTTSRYGGALQVEPVDLVGNTYNFDLGGAEYTEPAGLGSVIGIFLSEPLLVGVMSADDESISVMGAQGKIDDVTAEISQDTGLLTWDFGVADFTAAPFFEATSEQITIDYNGIDIPIYDFHLEGTFEPDGSSIGGAMARGLGDTRDMGPLLNLGSDPAAVCDFAAGLGLECETCPDEGVYCMTIETWFDPAELLDGLTLTAITE